MDRKVKRSLEKWYENKLINLETFEEIKNFENVQAPIKSKFARIIVLVGGLFLLSGLISTLPIIWSSLEYWAQLILLISITAFLYFSAIYSEKFENKKFLIFDSVDRLSSFLFFISTISFAAVLVFSFNILTEANVLKFSQETSLIFISLLTSMYSIYLYFRNSVFLQHIAMFYSIAFFFGSNINLYAPNLETWSWGVIALIGGIIWGYNTFSKFLKPTWTGYFISSSTISVGTVVLVEDLLSNYEILAISILIFGSVVFIWLSIQITEQILFFIGGLGLLINLPRLISAILPDNVWPPLILLLIGAILVAVGLYLNSIRENIKFQLINKNNEEE